MSPDGVPPLGQRPTEPTPGRESLFDPKGEQKAGQQSGADGKAPDTCPDCGLPFGEHPDFHMHDGGGGSPGWAEVDLGDPAAADDGAVDLGEADMEADDLPGQEIEQRELGGDPAEG